MNTFDLLNGKSTRNWHLRPVSSPMRPPLETDGAKRKTHTTGEILVVEPQTRDLRGRRISVPGGTIHHWRGTVFIANTDLE